MTADKIAPFYTGWRLMNDALVRAIAPLTPAQLATPIGRPEAQMWQSVSHLAGTRVFWLCEIFKEPGLESTPFRGMDIGKSGWEDDPSHPRRAGELVEALETTFRIVARVLDTWTPDSLATTARRTAGGVTQLHTRQSVLWRMVTHDAFHIGEISLAPGTHGIGPNEGNGPIDLWAGLSRVAPT